MDLNPLAFPSNLSGPSLETIRWLWRLRWVAVFGQLITIYVAYLLGFQLQFIPLLLFVAVTALSNVAFVSWLAWAHPESSRNAPTFSVYYSGFVVGTLLLDLVCLTGLLYWSGGVDNPFLFYYFVNIAMASLILRPVWAWGLTIVSILFVLLLLNNSVSVAGLTDFGRFLQPSWSVREIGFAIAFATSSTVVTYFVIKLVAELRLREIRLAEVEQQRAKSQRLEAMATLAAGAGHELASPLSTIAVISKELSRNLEKIEVPNSIRSDVALIRSELDRCREILARMKSSAGDAAAEKLDPITIQALMQEVLFGLRDARRVDLLATEASLETEGRLPVQAVALSFRNIIQNALDASPNETRVQIRIDVHATQWEFNISDQGQGMESSVLERIGEPFFTTKEPGRGMGMGIFLARNVLSRLGGSIQYESRPTRGTNCRVIIPMRSHPSEKE